MLNALVISADSVIGAAICETIGAAGTTRQYLNAQFFGRIPFDLRLKVELPLAQTTYFCSGVNGFKKCAADPEAARIVNVIGTTRTATDIVSRGGRVVLLSSCAAETHPHEVYGQLKLETENEFLKFGDMASIFRFGPVAFPHRRVYQNQDYHPISIERLVATVTAPFVPGLHRILNAPVSA